MYSKINTQKNKDGSVREYLQLVDSQWDPKKGYSVQRLLLNVARVDKMDQKTKKMLMNIADGILKVLGMRIVDGQVIPDLKKTGEKYCWGMVLLVDAIWKMFRFDKILKKIERKRKIEFSLERAIFFIVTARLYGYISENSVNRWIDKVYGFARSGLELHHLYRSLDILSDEWIKVERILQDRVMDLFNSEVDLMFIDTTSLIYWGSGDSICHRGNSKQKRSDKKQVIIGIAILCGLPVGIEVTEGNTADIDVMRKMIKNFSMRFSIGDVCIVSDCTMVSIDDLRDYRIDGLSYLVGARLNEKVVREKVEEFRAAPSSWTKVREKDKAKNQEEIYAREFDLSDEKLIVVLDKGTEQYDKDTRKRIIEKLRSKEGKDMKELVRNKGYKRYLVKGSKIKIDTKKIESSSLLDGIWVVKTNRNFSTLKEAVEKYKELSIIERCFRELKNYINVSPIYHRANSRIEGHIYASFLSLVVDFALLKMIKELRIDGVYDELKSELRDLRVEWLLVKDKEVLLRDEPNGWQKRLFNSYSIRMPPAILAVRSR